MFAVASTGTCPSIHHCAKHRHFPFNTVRVYHWAQPQTALAHSRHHIPIPHTHTHAPNGPVRNRLHSASRTAPDQRAICTRDHKCKMRRAVGMGSACSFAITTWRQHAQLCWGRDIAAPEPFKNNRQNSHKCQRLVCAQISTRRKPSSPSAASALRYPGHTDLIGGRHGEKGVTFSAILGKKGIGLRQHRFHRPTNKACCISYSPVNE